MLDARAYPAAIAVTVTVLVLLILSFTTNWSVVRDLSWPGQDIGFRELAATQTIVDEGYGPDPAYRYERAWYNPMATWLAAAANAVSHVEPAVFIARAGPFVNLIAPIGLFVLVAVLFDAFVAVAAVAAFIFIAGHRFPYYYWATYSPWFAPENMAQGLFYLSVAAAAMTFRPHAPFAWAMVSGVLLGLTFLTHTAPALLCGGIIVALAAVEWRRSPGDTVRRLAASLAVALIVSAPFARLILGHYHLRIVNPSPSQSPSDLLDLNELPALARSLLALPPLVALLALAARARARLDLGMRILIAWGGIAAAFVGAHVARLVLLKRGWEIPPVVPAFHFFFYLTALMAIGVGLGIHDGCRVGSQWLARNWRRVAVEPTQSGILTCAASIVCVSLFWPGYLQRVDFTELRAEALELNAQVPGDAVQWIRDHTSRDDVFLSHDDASMYVVGAAGRKVVATNRYFSNPYVDWSLRDSDRRRMLELLQQRDVAQFTTLARQYAVGFVIILRDTSQFWRRMAGLRSADVVTIDPAALSVLPGFTIVFEDDRSTILAVKY